MESRIVIRNKTASFSGTHISSRGRSIVLLLPSCLYLLSGDFLHSHYSGYHFTLFFPCVLKTHSWVEFVLLWLNVSGAKLSRDECCRDMYILVCPDDKLRCVCVCSLPPWKDELQHSWSRWWTHITVTFCLSVCVFVRACGVMFWLWHVDVVKEGGVQLGLWLWRGNMTKPRDDGGSSAALLSPTTRHLFMHTSWGLWPRVSQ